MLPADIEQEFFESASTSRARRMIAGVDGTSEGWVVVVCDDRLRNSNARLERPNSLIDPQGESPPLSPQLDVDDVFFQVVT